MARFCPSCGAKLDDTTRFCGGCGASVAQQGPSQQGAGQPPPYQQYNSQPGANKFTTYAQNTADETSGIDPADIEKNKTMGGLAYFIFFLPLVACPESRYGRFHANQALILFIIAVVLGIANAILGTVLPWRLGWISTIFGLIIGLIIFALGLIGLINGFSGKAKELPVVGKFRIIKH
jgi:uncharacterized membrane protein